MSIYEKTKSDLTAEEVALSGELRAKLNQSR